MQNTKTSLIFQKNKLIFIIGFFLVTGFLATTLVSYFVFKASIKKDILANQLPLTSDNIYSEIQNDLLTPVLVSSVMATDTFLRDWVIGGEKDVKQIANYLEKMKAKYNTITGFFVSERTRAYYYYNGILKQVREEEPRDKWYFRVRAMTEDYETNIDPDLANKDLMTIFINHKVFDYEGNFIGATGIGLSVNTASKLIENYQKRYNRQVYFVGRDGAVILSGGDSPPPGKNIQDFPSLRPIAKDILRSDAGSFEYTRNGKTVLLNTRFISQLKWYVFVEQIEEITAELPKTLMVNLVVCLAIMAVILFAVTFTIRIYQNHIEKDSLELLQANRDLNKAKGEAEEASRAKSVFLATMSHEIRTPISGILGMAELLLETKLSPEQQRQAETIHASGEALLSILNNILDFSKIEAGKLELEKTDFSLHQLLEELEGFFQDAARKKGTLFQARISPALPQRVQGDAYRLRQILMNLLSNALKFTEKGEVSLVAEPEPQSPSLVRFEVRDTGIGVDPEKLQEVFQPFIQADRSTTRKYGGTGLGLSIVHKLVEAMGGEIRVESAPGRGSVFTVTMPLEESREPAAIPAVSTDGKAFLPPEARLLIVEDDPTNQQVLLGMLKHLGLDAELANDGVEALEALKRNSFDLVFMDCNMPEMDGFSACRAFREWEKINRPDQRTPIVALTAHALRGDKEKCLEVGMDAYLAKPIRGTTLRTELLRWLGISEKRKTGGSRQDQEPGAAAPEGFLREMKENLGDGALAVIQHFRENLPQRVALIRKAIKENKFQELAREAHSLRGAGLSFGFNRIGELAGQLEALGESGLLQGAEDLLAVLEREAARAKEILNNFI